MDILSITLPHTPPAGLGFLAVNCLSPYQRHNVLRSCAFSMTGTPVRTLAYPALLGTL